MRTMGKMLELLLVCAILLGGAYVYSSWIGGEIANSLNATTEFLESND